MAVVQYKTPGVYIEELDAFPPSIVGVETAVPVFIGYTQKAEQKGRPLKLRPVRITSMADYRPIFGDAVVYQFTLNSIGVPAKDDAAKEKPNESAPEAPKTTASPDKAKAETAPAAAMPPDFRIGNANYGLTLKTNLYLYNSLRLFYANGGGDCYIVSVGSYDDATNGGILLKDLTDGLDAVRDLVGPTMLVIPEAVQLDKPNYDTLVAAMLEQCLNRQDRVAILDVWGIDKLAPNFSQADLTEATTKFREKISGLQTQYLRYGMAYAPFLQTSIVDPTEVSFMNFDKESLDQLWTLMQGEAKRLFPEPAAATPLIQGPDASKSATSKTGGAEAPKTGDAEPPNTGDADASKTGGSNAGETTTPTVPRTKAGMLIAAFTNRLAEIDKMPADDEKIRKFKQLNQNLISQIPVLSDIYGAMVRKLGILPPSPAIAGVYTQNDLLRGVWNAPANVGLVAVTAPTLRISDTMQHDLNVPIEGLAINAIRDFVGRGTLVWGARTLDGNSNDWRYIQVRRALIYIEQSVELALNKFVFAPNVAQTWVTVTSMIGSFLRGVWQAGGLMGASPAEAFSIQCGLGSTMTAQDVLEGRMIVQIKLTMVRPAEFIVLTFQQQMQGGA
jgi:phage tail sheath protein FI